MFFQDGDGDNIENDFTSLEELKENIKILKERKSKVFQGINENEVDGHMIEFKLRHIAKDLENKNVRDHVRELEDVTRMIRNITDSLENLELRFMVVTNTIKLFL